MGIYNLWLENIYIVYFIPQRRFNGLFLVSLISPTAWISLNMFRILNIYVRKKELLIYRNHLIFVVVIFVAWNINKYKLCKLYLFTCFAYVIAKKKGFLYFIRKFRFFLLFSKWKVVFFMKGQRSTCNSQINDKLSEWTLDIFEI